jgi:response regulator NasT
MKEANADGARSTPITPRGAGPLRVLIVEDEAIIGMGLRQQLEKLGHVALPQAVNAPEARALFSAEKPDLVLLDIQLNDADGIELAREFLRERRCPMIIISAFSDDTLITRATEAGVFGYLIKPVSPELLQAQIEVCVHRFREQEQLRQENEALSQTLETRKLVEKAKGIIMKRLHLDEPEAHRRLQQESQKRRVNIADLARKIIESEEILGG